MGMSIDEAIPILHDMYNYYNDVDVDTYVGFDKEDNNAIETALDSMRKYQKIQEIVTNNELEWGNTSVRANALWDVKKVVEAEESTDDTD